ncbi:hypothetical protein TrVFT333_003150 [Trichoderma virens FT-333]|nr:hypothetical protein TrVFT333_003150 [Trichoderma virens FT-333]
MGKRKAVKVMTVDRKKPKLRASSSMTASNTDTRTNIPTATAIAVDLTIPVRDKRANASSQGSVVHGRVPQTGHQQYNQEFSGSIKIMEEAIERCSALHQAQAEALELLRNQLQLVKTQYNAKEKQLGSI